MCMSGMLGWSAVVVNKDQGLADAVREIETIIAAEKLRVSRLFPEQSASQERSEVNS